MRLLILLAAACAAQTLPPAKVFEPKPPPEQPLPFSHKTHTGTASIKCLDCHAIKTPGDRAGFPAEAVCMGCHASIKKDSAAIAKLAEFAREKKHVPWVRVYKLPKTVYFSHEVHYKQAKVECTECHGAVAEREKLGQEKSIFMAECMACHDRMKASNKCDLCHDSH
ncbi:MAG: cytochrome c3 family protein [Bryobacteraceae bacterium]